MKRYHWLLVKDEPQDNWAIHFGDYDKATVKEEMRDTRAYAKKIVTLESDTQSAIDAFMEVLNANWRNEK